VATAEARAIGIPVVVESDVSRLAEELARSCLRARDPRV